MIGVKRSLICLMVLLLAAGCAAQAPQTAGQANQSATAVKKAAPQAASEDDAEAEETGDTASLPAPGAVTQTSEGLVCRSGGVLAGVYHPYRLQVVKPCIMATGKVAVVRHEKDGDYHINVAVDPPYADLVNAQNRAKQDGNLVVEVIPADRSNVPVPKAGQHVRIYGAYVLDKEHGGWAEIHPAWKIEELDIQPLSQGTAREGTQAPARAGTGTTEAPKAGGHPAGATARCKDGTYSSSTQHVGACSGHGGVAEWF